MDSAGNRDVPPVRLDLDNEWAWCGRERLELMPRTFAVLRHLVDHAGRLITKEELFTTVWRDTVVSDAALTSCIRDLRKALGDSPEAPRYIETVHRRGFRFIGPVAGASAAAPERGGLEDRVDSTAPAPSPTLVGRDTEFAQLHDRLGRALEGQRQLIFVTGEPGIGKTALVDAFLSQVAAREPVRIGRGQCVEHYGAGEAYLPVLEALGRLGRDAGGEQVVRVLRQHAPTWLSQLPSLLSDDDLDAVQRRAQGTTRERMLRELVEGLDALTLETPLVLVLEDLHWSDSSTIDLLAMVARRHEASRLLVLGTYRPADVAVSDHPLKAAKRELELHGRCEEIVLEFLSVPAVAEYLRRRFDQEQWPPDFAPVLHRRTDGNPLFLITTLALLLAQQQLRQVDGGWRLAAPVRDLALHAPETLAQMVEKQIERLTSDEQAMLAIAAVAGAEFSAAIAAGHGVDVDDAERRCEALARRGQFVRSTGVAEWPDGTVAGRYAFIHALYQHVLYARIPIGHRVELHLGTGARLEQAHGQRTREIASELARHFTEGRDFARAVRYHHQAAGHALNHHGYREAADHLTRALGLLAALPNTPTRREEGAALHVMRGAALLALHGHADRDVEESYARARALCDDVEDSSRILPVLRALGRFYLVRGSLDAARGVGQRLRGIAESTVDPTARLAAHDTLGHVSFYGGELEAALTHLERVIELSDPTRASRRGSSPLRLILDSGVSSSAHAAWALWMLGYPARAALRMRETLTLAHALGHPFSLAHARRFAAALHHINRERDAVREQAEASLALSAEHTSGEAASRYFGFSSVHMAADFHRGWWLIDAGRTDEGLAAMRAWVDTCRDTGSECLLPTYLAWLAETYNRIGQPGQGRALVDEALAAAAESGNHYWTAELHRLRSTFADTDTDAESSLREAITIAQRQHAKSFELRAATSLSRLWARQGQATKAHALLADVYAWFTEGFETADLRDARSLLDELEQATSRRKTPRRREPGL